jgi:ABC-type transport system substrate-binding protein
VRGALVAIAAATGGALFLAAAGSPREIKDGGTFRIAAPQGYFGSLTEGGWDLTRPACSTLMAYPDEPLPAGLRLAPELAMSDPLVSKDRRTYTFTLRKDLRFSSGAPVTARDLARALERMLTPGLQSNWAPLF